MSPVEKLLITLAALTVGNVLFTWIAAMLLLRDTSFMNPTRATVYQLLLWIPVAFVLMIALIPVANEVEMPQNFQELGSHTAALLVAAYVTGLLGVKWSYERNTRAGVYTYALALALQVATWYVLFDQKPELRRYLPPLDQLPLIGRG